MKIGLIALSGIRVVDRELFALGLNLPGFVERSQIIARLPSLGLLTLAGLTDAAHEVRYVEVPDVDAPEVVAALPGPFDLVALSTFTAMARDAYRLADRYRAAGTKVVFGGLHATLCPEETALHADAVVVGEGEPVWPAVVRDAEQGCLKPLYRASEPFDLGKAPMPRFDLLDLDRYNRLTVQTARGCPWNCEFCASSIRLHPSYRTKPVGKVLAEFQRIRELVTAPFIEFADDNTFADRRHGHALMDALAGSTVRWFTETDISVARDEALLAKMAKAGCAQILIGLEDPWDGLDGLELRSNWKARQRDRYLDDIRRIQDHGITVNGCFVLGLDTHTPEIFDRLWSFIQESGLYEVQLTVLTPFPGTPLQARLKEEGRLVDEFAWEKRTLFDITYRPARMSAEVLRAGLVDLAKRVYSAEFTDRRRKAFARRRLELTNRPGHETLR